MVLEELKKKLLQKIRICTATLSKRLNEFSLTPSAKLTPEEFEAGNDNIMNECNPPSFDKFDKFLLNKKTFVDKLTNLISIILN